MTLPDCPVWKAGGHGPCGVCEVCLRDSGSTGADLREFHAAVKELMFELKDPALTLSQQVWRAMVDLRAAAKKAGVEL